MFVRKATIQDLPYIYDICLKTGDNGKDATELFNDRNMLGAFYAGPYVVFDPDCCFLVINEGVPAGYILCAKDTNVFYSWCDCKWLPDIRATYEDGIITKTDTEKNLLKKIMSPMEQIKSPWIDEYPAHLHIDLMPSLQGKGMGRTLMETLFASLKENQVPGIHLGVGSENVSAQGFYKKIGFEVLEKEEWGLVLGKKI